MKKIIQYITLSIAITIGISSVFANELPQNIFQEDPAYAELQLCLQDPPQDINLICYEGFMKNVDSINTDEEMEFFLENVCDGSFEYNRVCMMAFGEKVAALPEAITHCDEIEEGDKTHLCKLYTIYYGEDFSDTDLEKISEICSNAENLSDETMEECYMIFSDKCGTKNDTSSSICSEKMPIFYWHPYTATMRTNSFFDPDGTNFGYGMAEPDNIEFCIERRANQCVREFFLTMNNEDEMKSACELTKGTAVEEICSSSMKKRLAEIQAEEEEAALLESWDKNIAECEEKMLVEYNNYPGREEIENREKEKEEWAKEMTEELNSINSESMATVTVDPGSTVKEWSMSRCSSYAFWVEQSASQITDLNESEIEALYDSWIHFLFLDSIYIRELSDIFLRTLSTNTTQADLEALKGEMAQYKTDLKDAKEEVDTASEGISEMSVGSAFINEDYDQFIAESDDNIDRINRTLYSRFGECPDNICELVEAEKAFEEEKSEPVFTDVDPYNKWATPIRYLKKTNVISGYPDETFKPDNTINRAELLKIAIESQFNESEIEGCISENSNPDRSYVFFTDIPAKEWYAKYVCMGKIHGIIKGYPDGTFQPQRAVNRAESIKIVMEVLGFALNDVEVSVKPYGDTEINEWFTPYIYLGKQKEIFSNTSYTFEPGEEIKRGEISEILYRLLAVSELEEEKYTNELDVKMFQLSE